jgi:hypothetical protein
VKFAIAIMVDLPKKQNSPYLKEDEDLLDELESINMDTTGTELEKRKYQVNKIQIKSVLRNRKTAVDLDSSNKRFSLAVILIAIIQLLIALFQFTFEVASASLTRNIIGGFILLMILAMVVFYLLKEFKNEFKK